MNDRQAAEFEKTKECQFAINPTSIGRFRVSAFVQQGKVGIVFRVIADHIPTSDELNLPPIAQRACDGQARHRARGRRHGLRQVDHAGGDDRLSQREQQRSHHHDRGSDRVRAPAQELHHHAARGRRRLRELGGRAEEHAASGARRDPDRRGSRSRGNGPRDRLCRNRPPGDVHAARELDQPGARPDHQLLPGRAAPAVADGPVAEPARIDLAAPDSVQGSQGTNSGGRDHAEFAVDLPT